MAKTIEYSNPAFEDGVVFDVGGLAIPNGGSIELTDEEELAFYARHQKDVSDFFSGDKLVKVSGKSELSSSDKKLHSGQDVSVIAESLDEAIIHDVEPPVDSEGEEVEPGLAVPTDEEVSE